MFFLRKGCREEDRFSLTLFGYSFGLLSRKQKERNCILHARSVFKLNIWSIRCSEDSDLNLRERAPWYLAGVASMTYNVLWLAMVLSARLLVIYVCRHLVDMCGYAAGYYVCSVYSLWLCEDITAGYHVCWYTSQLCSKLMCFTFKWWYMWWYMAYITLNKLSDQQCVSTLTCELCSKLMCFTSK